MIVQDPLSGYLHEVPDQPYYGDYYGGYDEYIDPSMAEYPGEMGHFGFLPFLAPIVSAATSAIPSLINTITGGGSPPPPPPVQAPPPPVVNQPMMPQQMLPQLMLPQQMMLPSVNGGFGPPPGLRAYIFSVVRDALSELEPEAPAYGPGGGGFRRRRRRR